MCFIIIIIFNLLCMFKDIILSLFWVFSEMSASRNTNTHCMCYINSYLFIYVFIY